MVLVLFGYYRHISWFVIFHSYAMDRCYLCNYNRNGRKAGIALHRFPRDPKIRKQWFLVCGLSEEVDEVKNVRICTSHFAVKDVRPPITGSSKKSPTLTFNAVPSISVPHPLPNQIDSSFPKNFEKISQLVVVPSDESSKKYPTITCTPLSNLIQTQPLKNFGNISQLVPINLASKQYQIVVPLMSTTQANGIQTQLPNNFQKTSSLNGATLVVGPSNNYPALNIQNPSSISQVPFLKNLEEIRGENVVSSFVNFKSEGDVPADIGETMVLVPTQSTETNGNITICGVHTPADTGETVSPELLQNAGTNGNITTSDELSQCDSKNRKFENPRYISEITVADLSNPKKANMIMELVKRTDIKKSRKIRELQSEKRYLSMRVTALKNLVKKLRADVKEANKINSKRNREKKIPISKDQIKGENIKKQKFENTLEETIILCVE